MHWEVLKTVFITGVNPIAPVDCLSRGIGISEYLWCVASPVRDIRDKVVVVVAKQPSEGAE